MSGQTDSFDGAGNDLAAVRPALIVFVSYDHADADDFAQRLKRGLQEHANATVWLDLERIEGGADWAGAIEDGIRGADTLLALMTAHSHKPGSVCQDEVVFAHVEGKHIVPLRLHADPSLRPSLLLVRRSWADFTGDYADALSPLVRALKGENDALLPAATPLVSGPVPVDFGPEIARHARGFAGREWLLHRLDEWLSSDRGRAFLVVGAPGIGKSAIAAQLCSQRDDVAAVHFCTASNGRTLDTNELVASVVGQLARLRGYKEQLAGREMERRRESASDAFRELIVEPARALPAPPQPLVIVVDALDEAARRDGESIVDVMARQAADLPSWLRIVATSRPETAVFERIRHLSPIEIDAAGEDNLADVSAYIEERIHEPRLADLLGDAVSQVAEDLGRLAAGNFLYAALALDALEDGVLTPADLAALTPGLSGYYAEIFRRAFPDEDAFADDLAPLLRCLAAGFAPVPADVLAQAADPRPRS